MDHRWVELPRPADPSWVVRASFCRARDSQRRLGAPSWTSVRPRLRASLVNRRVIALQFLLQVDQARWPLRPVSRGSRHLRRMGLTSRMAGRHLLATTATGSSVPMVGSSPSAAHRLRALWEQCHCNDPSSGSRLRLIVSAICWWHRTAGPSLLATPLSTGHFLGMDSHQPGLRVPRTRRPDCWHRAYRG